MSQALLVMQRFADTNVSFGFLQSLDDIVTSVPPYKEQCENKQMTASFILFKKILIVLSTKQFF